MAKIIQDYEISYPNPLTLKCGDLVSIISKELPSRWNGWFWAKTASNEGWISKHYFENRDLCTIIIKDYTAKEMSVKNGDNVKLIHEDCGWSWVENKTGEQGWIPSENIGELDLDDLPAFILEGKLKGWVGNLEGGKKIPPTRIGAKDVVFDRGDFHYHDSFVGFSDFLGQEHIAFKNIPVWSMSYYGYLLKPEIFTAKDAVFVLGAALPQMYLIEKKFLGGFVLQYNEYEYRDVNFGDWKRFHGIEKIYKKDELVYELQYFGGCVKE